MAICVYAPDADDFECMGLVGELTPTVCTHEEHAGGMSELTIEHFYDAAGKWRAIAMGNIIKAPVPVRTVPEIQGGKVVTTIERATVLATATKNERYTYSKATGGSKMKLLPVGFGEQAHENLCVVAGQGDRYKVKASAAAYRDAKGKAVKGVSYGTGWIAKSAIKLGIEVIIASDPAAIEAVVPAWTVQDQLFRIGEYTQTLMGVKAKAKHISYDLLGNLTYYKADQPTASQALDGILSNCASPHSFEVYTDIADTRTEIDWTNISPLKAIQDPETGFLARWSSEMVRDNFGLYFLRRAGMNRGVRVEYGKNLTGLDCKVNREQIVTKLLPVGQDKNGKPVYLSANPNVPSSTVTADSYITSPRANEYPTPHIQVIDVTEAYIDSKKGGATVTPELACARMRAAAQEQLDAGCDLPQIQLTVDFVALGDTVEYQQYQRLDDVYLYDRVRVYHPEIGVDISTDVVRVVYDCLTGKHQKVELGSLTDAVVAGGIASWQIYSVSGGKLLAGSVNGGALGQQIINTHHLQADSVTADVIAANTFVAGKIIAAISEIISANIQRAKIGEAEIDWANIANLNAIIANLAKVQISEAVIDTAQIRELHAMIVEVADAEIERAEIGYAQIRELGAEIARIAKAEIENASIGTAQIRELEAYIASITQAIIDSAAIKWANIDFSNIGEAAITKLFAGSGLIRNIIVGDGTITGELVGVTIKGDLIEGNTIVADKLVVKGEDGLYYKLNTDGVSVEAQQTEYNSLHGSVITAKSITATKISVTDLVAFDATIGGFKITANSLYSGVKSSVNNTTRGVYLDSSGQIAFGDASNFLKYYRDTDGFYKLAISAEQITFGASSRNVETVIAEIQENLQKEVERLEDEITTLLRIESSQGNVFKNDMIATVLQVVVYRGSALIRDMDALRALMGADVRLQWYERRINQEEDVPLAANDIRIRDYGFSLTLNPGDIDTKSTFRCELIT